MTDSYYGQFDQDGFVDRHFFKDQKSGTFVDIGASDGISINNTYYFEKNKGWSGICIEPLPETYGKLVKNRKCLCINGCISNVNGKSQFLQIKGYSEMLSGLVSNYSDEHMKRIETEVRQYNCEKELIEVNCYVLNDILRDNKIDTVDFCSIDTEGGELDILKTIDFSRYRFKAFSVENNNNDDSIKRFLRQKGFVLVRSVDCDEIYVHESLMKNLPLSTSLSLHTKLIATTVYHKSKLDTVHKYVKLAIQKIS